MPVARSILPLEWNLQDLLKHLGGIDARRIRFHPAPGSATEEDVTRIEQRENRLFELIDGVLVEKVMGIVESYLAGVIIQYLNNYVRKHKLGFVTAPDGTIRLAPRQVRIPDAAFFSWDQVPRRRLPKEPIPDLFPLLAVEVLSKRNTPREMNRKLKDYFMAGTQVVWFIYPRTRTARVYSAPDVFTELQEKDALDGGTLLPGFHLPLQELFADLEDDQTERKKKR